FRGSGVCITCNAQSVAEIRGLGSYRAFLPGCACGKNRRRKSWKQQKFRAQFNLQNSASLNSPKHFGQLAPVAASSVSAFSPIRQGKACSFARRVLQSRRKHHARSHFHQRSRPRGDFERRLEALRAHNANTVSNWPGGGNWQSSSTERQTHFAKLCGDRQRSKQVLHRGPGSKAWPVHKW